jgi:predicted transcriptional regulator
MKDLMKITKIFRIRQELVAALEAAAKKRKKTQTSIVEAALRSYLKVKKEVK